MTNRSLLFGAALLVLAGCSNVPPPYQGTDYGASAPARMNVAAVLVDNSYAPPGMAPNIDHQLQPTPQDVIRTALTQRYSAMRSNAVGAPTLRFEIKDASVTETALPQPEGALNRMFSEQPEYRYEGRLVVEASASGPGTHRTGHVHAEAARSLEVRHLSPAERQRQVQGLVAQMVDDVMAQIDQQIRANIGNLSYDTGAADFTITPQPSGRWDHVMNPPPASAGM